MRPLLLFLPPAAEGNLFCKCKRRSKCCVAEWGAAAGFLMPLGGRWDVKGAHPVPGSQAEGHDRSRRLRHCGSPRETNPRSSAVERGQALPQSWDRWCLPDHPRLSRSRSMGEPRGRPQAMLWGCSRGPVPFAATTPRIFPSTPGPWGQRELLSLLSCGWLHATVVGKWGTAGLQSLRAATPSPAPSSPRNLSDGHSRRGVHR